MIKIEDKLVSDELRSVHFVCDLHACKGACCVEGDSGAPLDPEEREILENIYPQVAPYLSETSRAAIYEQGPWVKDDEGYGTPLVAGKECAYVIHGSDGMAHCGIERAYRDGRIDWPKPISCHLYPVRIKPLGSIEVQALNYDTWDICKPACTLGKELKVPLYKFLKAPLIRKYGERFYRTMEDIFDHWPVG